MTYCLSVFLLIVEMANTVCLYSYIESIIFNTSCGVMKLFGCDFSGVIYSKVINRRDRAKARTIEIKMGCRRHKEKEKRRNKVHKTTSPQQETESEFGCT